VLSQTIFTDVSRIYSSSFNKKWPEGTLVQSELSKATQGGQAISPLVDSAAGKGVFVNLTLQAGITARGGQAMGGAGRDDERLVLCQG